MSGGGAGKVYFVLYLAVVLELLIIIVERDEAEEGLLRKQRETMKIVQSILSQLQSGAGTEGINTRPQDEITIPPPGIDLKTVMGTDIKSFRRYVVEVGVTDISSEIMRKEGESANEYNKRLKKLIELANVEEIEYQIFYNSSIDANNTPVFPSEDSLTKWKIDFKDGTKWQPGSSINGPDGSVWEFKSLRYLKLDKDKTFDNLDLTHVTPEAIKPVYPNEKMQIIGPSLSPPNLPEDSVFFYTDLSTQMGTGLTEREVMKKRAFTVNFQPPAQAGWYKLRFTSRTNRILGVRAERKLSELSGETTVNIGTVQLTVADLQKVQRELTNKLEKYKLPSFEDFIKTSDIEAFDKQLKNAKLEAGKSEDANEILSQIDLYGYICKLLAPGQSINFNQNRAAIEFNVRVITPKPTTANPIIVVHSEIHRYDALQPVFKFSISPYQGTQNIIAGSVKDFVTGNDVAGVKFEPLGIEANASTGGGGRDYLCYVDKNLAAGADGLPRKYKVHLTHTLAGKNSDTTTVLYIYPAIDDKKISILYNQFSARAFYCKNMLFNFIPPSGNKILPDEFCYEFKTDADQQDRGCRVGYSADINDKLQFPATAKKASLKILWNDPVTKRQVEIFPEKTVEINQEEPLIATGRAQSDVAGTEDRPRVRISNITVTAPDMCFVDDPNMKADITFDVDEVTVKIAGYKLGTKAKVTAKGNSYDINFDLIGQLSPEADGILKGTIDVKLSGVARNPATGKTSARSPKTISIKVSKRMDESQE